MNYEKEIGNLNKDATRLLELHKKTIKEKEELQNRINKAKQYVKTCKDNDMGIRYQTIEEILQGSDKE